MDPRARDIFLRALERDAAVRETFVRGQCGSDSSLRELVLELLRHHGSESILELGSPRSQSTNWPSRTRFRGLLEALVLFGGSRLRRRTIAVSAVVAFVGLAWFVHQAAFHTAAEQVYSVLAGVEESNATALRSVIAEWVRENETAVASGPARDAVLTVLKDPSAANWSRFDVFARHVLMGGEHSWYGLTDTAGVTLPGNAGGSAQLAPSEYGAALLAQVGASGTTLARILGTHRPLQMNAFGEGTFVPKVTLCTPVYLTDDHGAGRKLAGVFVVTRPLEPLARVLERARMFQTGESYLFSRDGVMLTQTRFGVNTRAWGLMHDPKVANGIPYLELRDPGRPLRETNGLRPKEDMRVWPPTLVVRTAQAALADPGEPSAGQLRQPYRDYRGELVVASWRWMPDLDTGIVSEIDAVELYAVSGIFDRLLIGLMTLIACGGIWAFFSSSWILKMRRELIRSGEMGQYSLVEKIGEGGMGEVYLARHPRLKRLSALKLLRRDRVDHVSQALFENEVQIASRLVHPNTVEIYDFGQAQDGTFYYVMQYLPGRDLSEIVEREGHLHPARVVHIARQISGALAEAHGEGLLHGDVKPSNVMLCSLGGMYDVGKLLDFGIAHPIHPPSGGVNAKVQSGTPYYTAPERLSGEVEPDGRADVYSFGVLCYYLLVGRMPHPPGIPWVEAVLTREPLRLGRLATVPEDLEALVMECIDRDPVRRPASAADLYSRFEQLSVQLPWSAEDARAAWRAADLA